ncbi:MAG: type 1 glutamine amidotransferase [Mariniphaga sp.]
MHILIINNAEKSITEFTGPLEKIVSEAGFTPETIEYRDCLEFNFEKEDGILLSGSPQGDNIVKHHLPWFQWLKTYKKPVLGICAGHHITGYLYGSELLRGEEPESGDFPVEILEDDPLFSGLPQKITVKQMHNDSISLPPGFGLLGNSKTCRNQIMKHHSKPLYTCQFHPEYYNQKLIQNFLKIVIKKKLDLD